MKWPNESNNVVHFSSQKTRQKIPGTTISCSELSTFNLGPVIYKKIKYYNGEAAFQAQKTTKKTIQKQFAKIKDPRLAKKFGSRKSSQNNGWTIRSNWDKIKKSQMKKILLAIFKQNKNLRKKLLATNDKILVHSGFRIDNYWGVKKNKLNNSYHGENNYGIILMQVRKYFQKKSKRRSRVRSKRRSRVRSKRRSRVRSKRRSRVRSKRRSRVRSKRRSRVRSKRRSRVRSKRRSRVRSKRRSRKPKLIKQKKKRSRVRMNREKQFIKCSIKNLNIERQLAPQVFSINAPSASTIIGIERFDRGRSGILSQMKTNLARLHILEQSGAHSLIIVKDNRLVKGWSIFEPNGKNRLPFKIIDRKENVSKDYMQISPENSINIGSDADNPGYCGIFGIIFMTFYKTHQQDHEWVVKWKKLLNKFNTSTKDGTIYGVNLAQNVQTLIHNTPTEKQLHELIPQISKLIK